MSLTNLNTGSTQWTIFIFGRGIEKIVRTWLGNRLLKANARVLGNRVYKTLKLRVYIYFWCPLNVSKSITWNHDFFAGDFWLLISSSKNTFKSAQYKFKTILCALLFFPVKLLCNEFRLVSLNSKFSNVKFCWVLFFFIIYYIYLFHYSFTYRYILFIYR